MAISTNVLEKKKWLVLVSDIGPLNVETAHFRLLIKITLMKLKYCVCQAYFCKIDSTAMQIER